MEQDTLLMMKQTLQQLQQYRAEEQRRQEPLAIVGMAARFPGSGHINGFWDSLLQGTDAVTTVPVTRWKIDDHYDPEPGKPGKTYTRFGAFISDIDRFDAAFFGISPVEALAMDPQQRLLLEISWRAFENAGYLPAAIPQTGVFMGVSNTEYADILKHAHTDPRTSPYFSTGNVLNAIPGRLSYTFGFNGPCMAVDTACSSSLVALHLACRSLREGECEQAIAGGVNLLLQPYNTIAVSQTRMLARDGHCKTFDAAADGYVRGEGCGVVIIKRLSDALRNHDRIYALVRGTAVNNNGNGSGFTVPDSQAQERLMRAALAQAGIEAATIDYLEAHGTGTALGDPIELAAAAAVYGNAPGRQHPLWTAAVKTNIGHLEAAAGIAGVIKTVLSLQHGSIPAHLHFHHPSPHVPWQDYRISIPVQKQDWPVTGRPARAAVSSFGFSGTNAHAILEAAPAREETIPVQDITPAYALMTLSAHTPGALQEQAAQYLSLLESTPDLPLHVCCKALQRLNPDREYRKAFVADTYAGLREQLRSCTAREDITPVQEGRLPAMVLTGHQTPPLSLYRHLYSTQPVFKAAVDEYFALIGAYTGVAPGPEMDTFTEAALFVWDYALVLLLQRQGIQPGRLYACRQGLWTAAAVAGIFTPADILRLLTTVDMDATALTPGKACLSILDAGTGEDITGLAATPAHWQRLSLSTVEQLIAPDTVYIGIGTPLPVMATGGFVTSEQSLLQVVAQLYENGITPDWNAWYQHTPVAILDNPPAYPFQYQRYWPAPAPVTPVPVYMQRWQPLLLADIPLTDKCWLLLDDSDSPALTELFAAQQLPVLRLSRKAMRDTSAWYWDPAQDGALKNVLTRIRETGTEIAGLIDVNLLLAGECNDLHENSTVAALYLRRLAAQLSVYEGPPLQVVLSTGAGTVAHVTAGMFKVMAGELPQHRFRHITFNDSPGARQWDRWLQAVMHAPAAELQIAGAACLEPVLTPFALPSSMKENMASFDPQAAYLLTGASGAIGQQLARWMLSKGCRHLLLVSRNGAAAFDPQQLAQLRSAGAVVTVYQADLSEEAAVRSLLTRCQSAGVPPLKGIFHAAGIMQDELLCRQEEKDFLAVWSAKAAALWWLHTASLSLPLDHFVAFSSSASLLGFPGQGAYAAANAFLNGVMEYRRQAALPGQSICWGPWDIGMAAKMPPAYRALLADHGVQLIRAENAFAALEQLLPEYNSIPVPVVINAAPAALQTAVQRHHMQAPGAASKAAPAARVLPAFVSRKEAAAYLQKKVEEITGIPAARISPDMPLLSLGLDSLMAIRLQQGIAADTGITINIAEILQGASLHTLSARIREQPEQETGATAVMEIPAGAVENLEDKKVDELLRSMLGQ